MGATCDVTAARTRRHGARAPVIDRGACSCFRPDPRSPAPRAPRPPGRQRARGAELALPTCEPAGASYSAASHRLDAHLGYCCGGRWRSAGASVASSCGGESAEAAEGGGGGKIWREKGRVRKREGLRDGRDVTDGGRRVAWRARRGEGPWRWLALLAWAAAWSQWSGAGAVGSLLRRVRRVRRVGAGLHDVVGLLGALCPRHCQFIPSGRVGSPCRPAAPAPLGPRCDAACSRRGWPRDVLSSVVSTSQVQPPKSGGT